MAVTTKQTIVNKHMIGQALPYPVASGETIYQGTIGILTTTGYLAALDADNVEQAMLAVIVKDDTANVTGDAATTANGSLSGTREVQSVVAGDKTVRICYHSGIFALPFTGMTQADVGSVVYASDNYTFSLSASSGIAIGTLEMKISSTLGYVSLNKFYNESGLMINKIPITAATTTTGGDAISWANPTGATIIIDDVYLNVTTAATGAATMDVGVAADGITTSDILIDGVDVGTAAIFTTAIEQLIAATGNAAGKQLMTTTQYITGTPSATLAGLVGTFNIKYFLA